MSLLDDAKRLADLYPITEVNGKRFHDHGFCGGGPDCPHFALPGIIAALEVLERLTVTSWHVLIATVQVLPSVNPVRDGACRVCHDLLESEDHDPSCIVPAFEKDVREAQMIVATMREPEQ